MPRYRRGGDDNDILRNQGLTLEHIQEQAKRWGTDVEEVLRSWESSGWNVDSIREAHRTTQEASPYAWLERATGEPLSIEQRQAVQADKIGQEIAKQDPIYQQLAGRAEGLLQSVQPERYRGLADKIGQLGDARQTSALDRLRAGVNRQSRWASGQDSVVSRQADLEREMLARGAQSQLASARGGYNPALQRAAMMGQSQAQADLAARTSIGRAMEQQAANQAFMQGAQGLAAGEQALGQNQERRIGQQAALQGMADSSAGGLLNQRNALKQQAIQNYGSGLGLEYGARTPQVAQPGIVESAMGLVGSIGSLFTGGGSEVKSDRDSKTAIREAGGNVEEFMGELEPYRYRYKDPQRHGQGERVGVMAQDMEQSQLGRMLVGAAPDGTKTINMSPEIVNPLMLASLANLNERLAAMEGRRQ